MTIGEMIDAAESAEYLVTVERVKARRLPRRERRAWARMRRGPAVVGVFAPTIAVGRTLWAMRPNGGAM